jgi:hypothetical protein
MPERVKSNAAILMGNSELIQNRIKDFLHDPSPVKRAAQFVEATPPAEPNTQLWPSE